MNEAPIDYLKGRGAQINTPNKYLAHSQDILDTENLHEPYWTSLPQTQFFVDYPKQIVNKVESPDIPLAYSMNPYQGCEHGCIYCYARNAHEYWGFSAGLDFETKIIVKPEAPKLLEDTLRKPNWEVQPIMFSGNTDCYQPAERKYRLTRRMLEVLLKYKHPVGMISKNVLISRDIDILQEMAKHNLVHVYITINSLREELRQVMEPRTATAAKRMKVIKLLADNNIPVGVMVSPIIPSLNNDEIPMIIKQAADNGAAAAGYTMVHLNGAIGGIFKDWIHKNFPDRAEKVLSQIAECHGGQLNDSKFGQRMRGIGPIAEMIHKLFSISKDKYLKNRSMPEYNLTAFVRTNKGQMGLF
jgi:DNA repair photolyase